MCVRERASVFLFGVLGEIFLTPLHFDISLYICFDQFILVIRLSYLRDNSARVCVRV